MRIAIKFDDDSRWVFEDVPSRMIIINYDGKEAWLEPACGDVIQGVRAVPKHEMVLCGHYAGYGEPCTNCRTGEQP
jgi:hypothetical protein